MASPDRAGHDSATWTIAAFVRAFWGKLRTLRVGEQLVIAASTAA